MNTFPQSTTGHRNAALLPYISSSSPKLSRSTFLNGMASFLRLLSRYGGATPQIQEPRSEADSRRVLKKPQGEAQGNDGISELCSNGYMSHRFAQQSITTSH